MFDRLTHKPGVTLGNKDTLHNHKCKATKAELRYADCHTIDFQHLTKENFDYL